MVKKYLSTLYNKSFLYKTVYDWNNIPLPYTIKSYINLCRRLMKSMLISPVLRVIGMQPQTCYKEINPCFQCVISFANYYDVI